MGEATQRRVAGHLDFAVRGSWFAARYTFADGETLEVGRVRMGLVDTRARHERYVGMMAEFVRETLMETAAPHGAVGVVVEREQGP